jgi:peptidoglycan/LPS O-acetylase OafA/YrhL
MDDTDARTGLVARKPKHFPCFDGLRAIAAVSVLVFHAATSSDFSAVSRYWIYSRKLNIGVAVFFLISGFLLYRPFVASHLSKGASPAAGRFWFRRLLRIVPAYWLALTIITYVLHDAYPAKGWWGVVVVYGFGQIYFLSQASAGLPQAWTLCVEMSFYLFLPLYAGLIGLRRSSPQRQFIRELVGLGVLTIGGFAYRTWVLLYPQCPKSQGLACLNHVPFVNYTRDWLPSYVPWFAAGMFLAVMSAWIVERERQPSWLNHPLFPWVSWIGAAGAFWWLAHLRTPNTAFPSISVGVNTAGYVLSAVFALLLLLPAVFGPQGVGVIRGFLRCWPVASIGVISYGIYLWHAAWINQCLEFFGHGVNWGSVPALGFLVLCVLALSIASASGSYFALERPVLRYKATIGWWKRRKDGRRASAA